MLEFTDESREPGRIQYLLSVFHPHDHISEDRVSGLAVRAIAISSNGWASQC